jgi:hypothetical protein
MGRTPMSNHNSKPACSFFSMGDKGKRVSPKEGRGAGKASARLFQIADLGFRILSDPFKLFKQSQYVPLTAT